MAEQPAQEHKRASFAKEKGEIVIRDHVYDGIEEFDQKLPNWWLSTFYIAIFFFVAYWGLYYSTNLYQTDQQKVEAQIAAIEQKKSAEFNEKIAKLSNEDFVAMASDPASVAAGQAIFTTNCVACHAADLSATMVVNGNKIPLPGLPLTDHKWKYGNGEPRRLFQLINEGTPKDDPGTNGARMQAWGQTLSLQQIQQVLSYVISKVPEDFETYRKK